MTTILVVSELRDGELRNVSYEAIHAAKQLKATAEVVAVVMGNATEQHGQALVQAGAGKVLLVKNEQLHMPTAESAVQALRQVIEEIQPSYIVLGHTSLGKDVAPRLAARLQAALISDVIKIEENETFTRPIYAGKAFETRSSTTDTTIITIRPNNIEAAVRDEARTGEIEEKTVELQSLQTVIKDIVRNVSSGVDLSEAKVIVAGGRGVKSEEGFAPLQQLANVLGGAVGASRGACDAGYCDYALQIGQTGKVVTPDLYIACGISGAIQHVAGMSNAKIIVAINKDPEANIFSISDYGIVGDLFEIVPLLIEELKQSAVTS